MTKKNYLHESKNKSSLIKSYYIALIPLIIFSIYKNGILLYMNDLIHIKDIFIPIYFFAISVVVAIIISYINKEGYQENILFSLIIASTISINTNLIIYPILLFVGMFIVKYLQNRKVLNINILSVMHLLMVLAMLLQSYSYLNIAEKLDKFNYNLFDVFLGYNSGGLATTSLFCVIIGYIILFCNKYYKRNVAMFSCITYFITLLGAFLITNRLDIINLMLSGNAYFAFVFIASDLYVTPYNTKGMMIYGTLIGITTGILSIIFNLPEISYIVILISSIFIPFINKITNKLYLHS